MCAKKTAMPIVFSALLLAACHHASTSSSATPDRAPTQSVPEPSASPDGPQAPSAATQQVQRASLPDEFDLTAIDNYLRAQVEDGPFIGLSAAIMRNGEIVLAKGYGNRSIEAGLPVEPTTKFAIASVTKQFTCAAALLLQEQGKLQLRARVADYYPRLTRAGDITLLDTLNHISGYPDYYPFDFVVPEMGKTTEVERVVQNWGSRPLDFEPRTRWSYSNTGYLLVGRVIERTTQQGLGQVMAQRLFGPLGMRDTLLGAGSQPEAAATGYMSFALGAPEPAPPEGQGWLHAAAGIWSTPTDLLRWDLALVDGKILSPDSYAMMTATPKLLDGSDTHYGCGLGISQTNGETVLSHGGSINGYLTSNSVVPRTKSGVVIMSNNYQASPSGLVRGILELVIAADRGTSAAPQVDGPPIRDVALNLLHQMQAGKVDHAALSDDFNSYMTDERVAHAAPRLRALGEPLEVELGPVSERGGMEVTRVRFVFKNRVISAKMFRTPDGKIQQFILADAS